MEDGLGLYPWAILQWLKILSWLLNCKEVMIPSQAAIPHYRPTKALYPIIVHQSSVPHYRPVSRLLGMQEPSALMLCDTLCLHQIPAPITDDTIVMLDMASKHQELFFFCVCFQFLVEREDFLWSPIFVAHPSLPLLCDVPLFSLQRRLPFPFHPSPPPGGCQGFGVSHFGQSTTKLMTLPALLTYACLFALTPFHEGKGNIKKIHWLCKRFLVCWQVEAGAYLSGCVWVYMNVITSKWVVTVFVPPCIFTCCPAKDKALTDYGKITSDWRWCTGINVHSCPTLGSAIYFI